jgi:molybdopterin synthase catalytic subunit
MVVQALFFASYRDLAGREGIEVDLPEGASAGDLIDQLRSSIPAFSVLPSSPAVAVNLTYAPLDTTLSDGDEIALIPPVAGG